MSAEPTKPIASEEAEPVAGKAPAPTILITILALLVYWGMIYLDAQGGGFDPQVYRPYVSEEMVKDLQPKSVGGEQIARGKITFTQVCSACHSINGMGSPAQGGPPLAGSDWAQAEGPNRIIRIVLNGLTGPITVSGGQYGTANQQMTAFKDSFTDEQIADVLTFVRQEWGNKAGPVKPEQVKTIRETVKDRNGPWTPPELLQIPDKD